MVLEFLRPGQLRPTHFLHGQTATDPDSSGSFLSVELRKPSRADRVKPPRGIGCRQGGPRFRRLGQRGFGTLGGSLALLAALTGIALAKVMYQIKDQTETQIKMDRCNGEYVIHLRAAALAMEKSYSRLNYYRGGVLAVCVFTAFIDCAPAIEAFNQAADIERGIQRAIKIYWEEQALSWNTVMPRQCGLPWMTLRSAFPPFKFPILKEGHLSLFDIKGSSFAPTAIPPIELKLSNLKLSSVAELKKQGASRAWTVRWIQ